jgi:hypothetical protein
VVWATVGPPLGAWRLEYRKHFNFFLWFITYIMSESEGIPQAMQWQIKRLKVLQKETIPMTPNKNLDVKPGQTIIVDLPCNSKVDLSSFSWFFYGSTTHMASMGEYAQGNHKYIVTKNIMPKVWGSP